MYKDSLHDYPKKHWHLPLVILRRNAFCRPQDAARAKYELKTSLRTHMGADDGAFLCMGDGQDEKGFPGVFLRKNVIEVASQALHKNLTALAPRVLPLPELVRLQNV